MAGKTVTTVIPAPAVVHTRGHVAEYRRFRGLVRDFLEASEHLCDAQVGAAAAPSGTRLKRTGMHWTVAGADAIIALRCCRLSGRFGDSWERRSARRVSA